MSNKNMFLVCISLIVFAEQVCCSELCRKSSKCCQVSVEKSELHKDECSDFMQTSCGSYVVGGGMLYLGSIVQGLPAQIAFCGLGGTCCCVSCLTFGLTCMHCTLAQVALENEKKFKEEQRLIRSIALANRNPFLHFRQQNVHAQQEMLGCPIPLEHNVENCVQVRPLQ